MDQGAAPARHMFGPYEIIETVGQGGMGVVYRAYDTTLKRVVALKILRDDLREQPHLVARFKREAEAFASLNHPNIVHIYSVGRVGRIPYLAMECIDGTPLSRLLKTERRLPWQRALDIALEIAQALACAHRAGIIHRDIKPGNIIIGQDGHAYVTDFGIAKVLNAETQLTVDGARLGTPQYMSPERCQSKETTASSDIYSLGILLYQMIAGRLPFQSDTPVALIQQIMVCAPPRLSSVCPGVPENVDRLVAYMIEKDPSARPQSAEYLCEIIERVRAGKPIVDHDGEASATLREYREAQTPTPIPGAKDHTSRRMRVPGRWVKTLRADPRYARAMRIAVVALLALIGFTASLFVTRAAGRQHAVIPSLDGNLHHWQAGNPLVTFMDEASGLRTVTIHLPHFEIITIGWLDGANAALHLAGRPDSPRAGTHAFIELQTTARAAAFSVPPFMSDRHAIALASAGGGTIFTWLASQPDSLLAIPASISGSSATDPIRHPLEASIGRDALIGHDRVGALRQSNSILLPASAGTVRAVHRSADHEAISFIEERSPEDRELYVWRKGMQHPQRLLTGAIALTSGTFNPQGTAVLATRMSGAVSELIQVPLSAEEPSVMLGDGGEAGFTHRGSIVTVASDNQARSQLWRISPHAPERREQLTFLGAGVASICRMNPDGTRAIAAATTAAGLPMAVVLDTTHL